MLSREWRCSWSSADRRCSNYIWVIDKFIAYWGASYIRDFTVFRNKPSLPEPIVTYCQLKPKKWFSVNSSHFVLASNQYDKCSCGDYFCCFHHERSLTPASHSCYSKHMIFKNILVIDTFSGYFYEYLFEWIFASQKFSYKTGSLSHNTELILGLHPANKRRCYKVTPSLIGWERT